MTNVGFVLYQRGREKGTLEARWCHKEDGQGIGMETAAGLAVGYRNA